MPSLPTTAQPTPVRTGEAGRAGSAPAEIADTKRQSTVPFVDLEWQHSRVANEVRSGFDEVMGAQSFIGGTAVETFEEAFAAFMAVRQCIAVANGTDALEIALRALGVGPGDEVIVPANTFVATAEAVSRAGATVVLVDVDPAHLLIDPVSVAEAITPRTRAIIPVHLYGQAAPVESLTGFGIPVVEDAAQSQGATRHGVPTGALGTIAGTSFYPGKNLGAYGDAGAVLTSSPELATLARKIANHGSLERYRHEVMGFNSRMDALQAVVLTAKLRRLKSWNSARREAAARYAELLGELADVTLPHVLDGNEHVWHLYVVQVRNRAEIESRLQAHGIGYGVHYPMPVHLHPAFAHLGRTRGSFPVAEQAAARILSLPMHPGLTLAQQERVAEAVGAC